jgi:hypothetical protein
VSIIDDLPPIAPEMQRVWRGFLASGASTTHELIDVFLPEYSDRLRWKRCRWNPQFQPVSIDVGEALEAPHIIEVAQFVPPVRGMPCLCVFDNTKRPWVVVYWPY